jgi:hypothetical protein
VSKAARKKPAKGGGARPVATQARDVPGPSGAAGGFPVTLRVAVWLLALEGLALGTLAAVLLYGYLRRQAQTEQGAIGVIGYVVAMAAILGVLSWALARRRGWARGPAIVLHMFLLPLGFAFVANGAPLVGAIALLAGIGGCVVLLAPGTRIAVGRQ